MTDNDLRDMLQASYKNLQKKNEQESNATTTDVASPSFIDDIKMIVDKGKEAASKLYQRSFFDVTETPDFMKELGLFGAKFTIRYGVISRHIDKDAEHALPIEAWERLPEALQHPFAISKYFTDEEKKQQKGYRIYGYRIYTNIKLDNGSFVVVSAEVKNAG